ncbi:hypothetical protein [Streptomyces sp. RerS4]|uniref:hypothetical protein n=1 Tax=Streptomyces sp. RerS4 TaxID=2942449 RepID=UPI00201BD34C|nr:hypothetical protein [Streptomyces sp. RerS4]UQW99712.1 hypothetical protein M4D82_03515 [Streptomyces sp. RerS4]
MTGGAVRHRFAWNCAASLSAVLVIAAATWQVRAFGAVRGSALYGDSAGRTVTAVEIDGGAAEVSVTPRGDGLVGYRARVGWTVREPVIEQTWHGDTLRLTPRCAAVAGVATDPGCSVRLTVTVPAGIAVKVSGGSGKVSVTGLDGAVDAEVDSGTLTLSALRGPLRAHVGSGELRATGLASPQAEIRADSGRADAAFEAPPDRVTGRVGAGRLLLTLPEEARYRVRSSAGAGRSEVADSLGDPASPRTLDLTAESGHATARYLDPT